MERWRPPIEVTKREQLILERLGRVRTLFEFLREKRRVLFDDAFQAQLEEVYRQTGAGEEPHPPATTRDGSASSGIPPDDDADLVANIAPK
jgi:hypothetical protein